MGGHLRGGSKILSQGRGLSVDMSPHGRSPQGQIQDFIMGAGVVS